MLDKLLSMGIFCCLLYWRIKKMNMLLLARYVDMGTKWTKFVNKIENGNDFSFTRLKKKKQKKLDLSIFMAMSDFCLSSCLQSHKRTILTNSTHSRLILSVMWPNLALKWCCTTYYTVYGKWWLNINFYLLHLLGIIWCDVKMD